MEEQKKVYDTTVAFTFFGDWVEAIEDFETEEDRNSKAYMLFRAIAEYSMYDIEPDFDNGEASRAFKAFWPILSKQILSSRKQRQRGRGFVVVDGPDDTEQKIINEFVKCPSVGQREVARKLGIDKNKVHRTVRKYAAAISDANANAITNADAIATATTKRGTAWDGTGQWDSLPTGNNEAVLTVNDTLIKSDDDAAAYRWKKARYDRLERMGLSPDTAAGKIARTLARYLSTHEETPLQKKYGDKYGRFVLGWDAKLKEPIIGYSVGYVPHELEVNKIADVPEWYYTETEWMRKIECIKHGIREPERPAGYVDTESAYNDDSLPF